MESYRQSNAPDEIHQEPVESVQTKMNETKDVEKFEETLPKQKKASDLPKKEPKPSKIKNEVARKRTSASKSPMDRESSKFASNKKLMSSSKKSTMVQHKKSVSRVSNKADEKVTNPSETNSH